MSARGLWHRLADAFTALSPRDRRALTVGALLLVPVLLWLTVVRPYRSTLLELGDRVASERALLERERSVLAEAPGLPSRLEAAERTLGHWEGRLVRSANPALAEAEVSARLEDVARESRVLLQEVRTVARPPGDEPLEGLLPIRLSIRGESDFEGVLRFLHGVERDALLLRIVGLSVNPVPAPAGGGGRGGGPGVQPGAMTFVVIVEAFVPAEVGVGGTEF